MFAYCLELNFKLADRGYGEHYIIFEYCLITVENRDYDGNKNSDKSVLCTFLSESSISFFT